MSEQRQSAWGERLVLGGVLFIVVLLALLAIAATAALSPPVPA